MSELAALLESPEISRLTKTIEYVRWTGRPGYGVRPMVGMMLIKSLYALPTWSRTCRLVAEHQGLQDVLGCVPSQWACYRFAKMLSNRDNWTLSQCIKDVLESLQAHHPEMGREVAIDASDMPAYSNGRRTYWNKNEKNHEPSDPDASWGYRTAVSTRASGAFFGYKVDAAVDVATGLPIAWKVRSAKHAEQNFALDLLDRAKAQGFDVRTAIMDKGYDTVRIHNWSMERGVAPVIPLRETNSVKKGSAKPPCCEHGEWAFAGADYKRKATKWRCPTSECTPASTWIAATRLHPLIPRGSKRFKDLYRKRGSIEREFGRLKHEWALLPLRVRGVERVQLHADLTILAKLATALSNRRAIPTAL